MKPRQPGLPDPEARFAQAGGQFDFRFAGSLAGTVVDLVQRRKQAQTVVEDEAVRLDVGVDERLAEPVAWVGASEARFVPDLVGKLDNVDVVMVSGHRAKLWILKIGSDCPTPEEQHPHGPPLGESAEPLGQPDVV